MKVVLDQNFPVPVGQALTGHTCQDAYSLGWAELTNGALLAAAEAGGFDVLLTADRNLAYQQNLAGRRIAIRCSPQSIRAMPGSYEEVTIPRPKLKRRPWPRQTP